jgi:plastocyanin
MRSTTWVAAVAGTIALIGLSAACGGDDDEETKGGSAATQTIDVSGTDFQFDPSTVTVDGPGSYTFRLVNDGQSEHALEIEGNGRGGDRYSRPGETAEVTVDLTEAGEYEMYCPLGDHRDRGMEGTITVSEG